MVTNAPADAVCVGAGSAVCGMVRQSDGVVRFGPNIGWRDEAFGETLARRLSLGQPVLVGNDANLGALAEHMRGAGVGCDNLIYLHGDVGIGGGIIVGGKLLTGLGGYGGEIGHMVINPDGSRCSCGSQGCLESEVGERALLAAAGRAEDPRVNGRDAVAAVVDAAGRGDVAARDALHRVGDWLGLAVANLVNIFNPGLVVFGGMLREIYLGSAAQVRSRMATNVLAVSREKVRIRTPDLGDESTLVGAAELAFFEVLNSPLEALTRARRP
jgi:predicted NBD/HSP70 family sugar kinase